jgi:hypothetical protein
VNFGVIDSLHYGAMILKVGAMHMLMQYGTPDEG